MKIAEILQKAQYSRITIGCRWLIWTSNGWTVLEKKRNKRIVVTIIETFNEDTAVLELLKGELDLYSDVIKEAKS